VASMGQEQEAVKRKSVRAFQVSDALFALARRTRFSCIACRPGGEEVSDGVMNRRAR